MVNEHSVNHFILSFLVCYFVKRGNTVKEAISEQKTLQEEQIILNFFFITIGIIFLVLLWLRLDYWLGRRNHLKNFVQPIAIKRKSNIEVFTDGELLFKDYFDELKRAKKHIHILFYIAKDDQFSAEFFQILIKKASEGVEVRLLLDWAGSRSVSKEKIQQLREAGGQFSFCYVPKLPFLFYTSQTRNHRKITAIDGSIGYLGGFNIGKEYVNQDKKLNPWRDYHLKITGEGVQDLQREFLKDWQKCMKVDLLQNEVYFPPLQPGTIEHEITPSEGIFLENKYLQLINSAKHTIMIGSPYFIPSKSIYDALLAAIDRGVSIKVLVPKITDHMLVKEASYPYFRRLIKNGVEVYEFLNGFYHAKTLVFDDNICDIGTANFDKRSFFLNYEINCYFSDKDFIKKVKEMISKDFQDAKLLTLEELNKPNWNRSLKEKVATLLSHFL